MVGISAEELKIRSELGMEIENGLEKEIKESIYHLALGLHRIYQEKKERSAKETFELTEVNVSIRMEGRTEVEIREVKNVKKVDWVKTLRRGSSPVCDSRFSNVSSKPKGKKLSTDPNSLSNRSGKKGCSFGQVKQNASVDKKILQLRWKV
ncbi:uncharacterized protein LOC111242776 [Vigna radiata var. radiata]|uniref:Uncharacterized protein LOC111242776 n=1 Tax=Vigna radiata var. radiata TaxID=3916 RepID=A0A3Q0FHS6_VIGRR|nr:uncharacterized protein LOC111242776 [Vigna radiata var. radiata]